MFGNLVGGLMKSMGLGPLGDLASLAINAYTGNWMAMVGDLKNLVSQFSDSSFLDKFEQTQPLGEFGEAGGFLGGALSSDRLGAIGDLLGGAIGEGLQSFAPALQTMRETVFDGEMVSQMQDSVRLAGVRV